MKHIYSLFSILFAALLMAGCVNDPDIDGGIRNAKKPSVKIVLDNRLRERKLSSRFIEDTEFEKTIQYLWQNPDKSLIGGESNREALNRILDLFEDLEERYSDKTILLSSHGNLLGILINHFDSSFDYKKWGQMTFPDCFLVDKDKSVKRIMKVTSR